MATKKYKIQQLQSDETLLTLHPETDANIVLIDSIKAGVNAKNVESAIKEINENIKAITGGGVVTGVKGSNETEYRIGQVEITKANIGLGNVNNTSDLDKPISTATQQAIDNVIAIANGKTKTYVISYTSTTNTSFNSNEDKIDFHHNAQFYDTTGKTFSISDLKLGDVILLAETDIPDRYVGKYIVSGSTYDVSLYKLETRKVDLSGYQLADDDLTNIAKLTGTGLLRRVNDSTSSWELDTTTYATKTSLNSKVDKNSGTATNLNLEATTTFKNNSVIDMSKSGVSISVGANPIGGSLGSVKFGAGTGFIFEDLTANILSFRNSKSDSVYNLTAPTKSGTIAVTSDIPTKTSQLTNDSVYISKTDADNTYATKTSLNSKVDKNSGTATNLTLEGTTSIGTSSISGGGLGSVRFGTGTGFIFEDLSANKLRFENTKSNTTYDLTVPTKSGTIALQTNTNGSFSAVSVSNGIVTEGAQIIEVGAASQTEPSANLAIGGIFFKEI